MTILINQVSDRGCPVCGKDGQPVFRKTVLLMLKAELLEIAQAVDYEFCSTRECEVVYFDEAGNYFTPGDLRVRVGIKAHDDPIPLCYCFGFDESHMRDAMARSDKRNIAETISRLIGQGMCACDLRNPAGICCLGEVNRTQKRLTAELERANRSATEEC